MRLYAWNKSSQREGLKHKYPPEPCRMIHVSLIHQGTKISSKSVKRTHFLRLQGYWNR